MLDMKPATLATPAADAVRLIALDLLLQAAAAARRLGNPADVEALHDFRVALRRLRSTARAYRPQLEERIPRRLRRRLRDIARATSAGRDAEVHLEWLNAREAQLDPRGRAAIRRLITRLEARRRESRETVAADVQRQFDKAERQLGRRLSAPGAVSEPGVALGPVAADAIRHTAPALETALGALRDVSDGTAAHAARIATKRLRYVLEPLRSAIPGAEELIGRLKELQDQLGRFQDLRTLADEARAAAADDAAARAARLFDRALARPAAAGPLPARRTSDAGLVTVAALVRAEQDQVFGEINDRWLGEHAGELSRDAERLAATLARGTAEARKTPNPRRSLSPARRARSRGPGVT